MVASLAFVHGRCSRWRAVSRIVQRSSSASEPHDRSKSCCPRADTRMVAQKRPTNVTKSVTKPQFLCFAWEIRVKSRQTVHTRRQQIQANLNDSAPTDIMDGR